MGREFRALALIAVLAAQIATNQVVAAENYGSEDGSREMNDMLAAQFDYYDELDLNRFESLEAEFGGSSRVFRSVNAVRFGQLEVRAKLVVPRTEAKRKITLFSRGGPEPVRVMLDYALVSCRDGCKIGVLTEPGGTTAQFSASHDDDGYPIMRRTASMVLIEGKSARLAIRQLNGSRRAHIALITAVHGAANFEFDTSAGAETNWWLLPVP